MKNHIFWLTLLFGVLFPTTSFKQTREYPQGYFRAPVLNTLLLTGTFGELRPNHFHAGIDIKGKTGDAIVAAAEGYISRVKIQAGGYGNCLYVTHPNGYTSLYAHLDDFMPQLAEYLEEQQYNNRTFELDIQIPSSLFPVRQGQTIAELGNTGSSTGPHLHFEIRDSYTERVINPLLFGLYVSDSQAPKLYQVKAYALNDARETQHAQIRDIIKTNQTTDYRIMGDTIKVAAWRVGFGLKAYDYADGLDNMNGVFAIELYENDALKHRFEMESFSFDETRYINAHTDYLDIITRKSFFNRCYRLPGNQLSAYKAIDNEGVIELNTSEPKKITLAAYDINGNRSQASFWVKRDEMAMTSPQIPPTYRYIFPYNDDNALDNENLQVFMPRGTLYENLYLQYYALPDYSTGVYSDMQHIHDHKTPIHHDYTIGIKPNRNIPLGLESKLFIAHCKGGLRPINCGGRWQGSYLVATARSLGGHCIMLDTVPPSLQPVNLRPVMGLNENIVFKIRDNFGTDSDVEGISFNGYLDGQWVLFEHDAKSASIRHHFDQDLPLGTHNLRLTATDALGNERTFERDFTLVEKSAPPTKKHRKRKKRR